jgi:hypothetical protein
MKSIHTVLLSIQEERVEIKLMKFFAYKNETGNINYLPGCWQRLHEGCQAAAMQPGTSLKQPGRYCCEPDHRLE